MNPSYIISVKRTAAQAATAWLVAQAARAGIELPGDAISDLIFAAIFTVYYIGYRAIEQRYPKLLKALGATQQPNYENLFDTIDDGEHDGHA